MRRQFYAFEQQVIQFEFGMPVGVLHTAFILIDNMPDRTMYGNRYAGFRQYQGNSHFGLLDNLSERLFQPDFDAAVTHIYDFPIKYDIIGLRRRYYNMCRQSLRIKSFSFAIICLHCLAPFFAIKEYRQKQTGGKIYLP